MAYCDYTFYTTKYLGNVIAEADFPRLAERASEKLDVLTFERISISNGTISIVDESGSSSTADTKLTAKIKKATCKIAEILADIEKYEMASRQSIGFEATENGMKSKVISSVSSGTESISYATSNAQNCLVGSVVADRKAQEKLIYESVKDYLTGTGLLYAGF